MLPLFTFGDLVMDVVARVNEPLAPDSDTPGEIQPQPGGSAANFAVWTARLGSPVRFAGRVGDDVMGQALIDDLRREGVEPYVTRDPEHPTAVLVLFTGGAQRHMMIPQGANHHFSVRDLPEAALRGSGWLHVTGYSYFWEAPAQAAERAVEVARQEGIPISLDPSSASYIRRRGLTLPEGLQVLMPNRDEALALTGCDTVEEAARELGRKVPLVAVKLGAEGALLCHHGEVVTVPPVRRIDNPVDTTGAGDAWGAAFVHALRRGHKPEEAARRANLLAAEVITRLGARPSFPLPSEVL
ncbi:MAG TPA: sugar kinase [Symbiobacteriaceae bacterium]